MLKELKDRSSDSGQGEDINITTDILIFSYKRFHKSQPYAEVAFEAANAAIAGGVSVLEIVMSTPGVFEVLQQLVKEHPKMTLGVGTVLRIEDAKTAINAGAKFLMSPAIVKDIMDHVQGGEVLYIPGAMTPTEVLRWTNLIGGHPRTSGA
ncbi:hypothetical protein TSUD_166780 [Trifolium subterraneum]|uniref:KHG/KDPG aldolase n=1 Tax=Trifolium subterraneum TaxID=3900 RepID=A0A2Z6M2F4_TRISU|nr:hypothetical protein TSUD_166780 [Trifolium subterraneum]